MWSAQSWSLSLVAQCITHITLCLNTLHNLHLLYTFQIITIKITENTQLIKATIKTQLKNNWRSTIDSAWMNYNEIVVRMTNMLRMYDEPSMRKTMSFRITRSVIRLSAWADELRGAVLHPLWSNKKKNKNRPQWNKEIKWNVRSAHDARPARRKSGVSTDYGR